MADWGYCEGGEDMNNLGMGILFLCFSLFLRYYSPREKGNMLGYKSPQQGMRRNVWFWSNRCFGKLALAGSAVYFAASIILLILGKTEMAYKLNLYIIPYLLFSTGVTEIYTFIRVRRKDETGNRALYPHEDRKTPERNEK